MHLVMFDIDGTLLQTKKSDIECFLATVKEVLGVSDPSVDWNNYPHATDSSIAETIISDRLGRDARPEDFENLEKVFMEKLKEAAKKKPDSFLPVPGAEEILKTIEDNDDYAVAVATGAWKGPAIMKLGLAGISVNGYAMAFSGQLNTREDIMNHAQTLAAKQNNREFCKVTYVGDGPWDVQAANNMGYNFIGIGQGENALKLKNLGATHIFPDYNDQEAFFRLLEE